MPAGDSSYRPDGLGSESTEHLHRTSDRYECGYAYLHSLFSAADISWTNYETARRVVQVSDHGLLHPGYYRVVRGYPQAHRAGLDRPGPPQLPLLLS